MNRSDVRSAQWRLLVLTPTIKDAALTRSILERAGIECLCCVDLDSLCNELPAGAAAVVLPEECIAQEHHGRLTEWLAAQEPWSDLPIIVLAQHGADSAAVARAMDLLGNVTVMERPTRVSALVSAARSALRARQRQYQIRQHLAESEKTAEVLLANDRRKDEFLAMLAHELRNPLAPIVNSIQILRLSADQDPKLTKVYEMMERQVGHMVRLVDDLMEVSRITRGKIELRRERVELADVVRTAVESIRPSIDAAGHELVISAPSTPLVVEADPVRLGQVLTNLLSNAVKYTDPGGRIWLTTRQDEDRAAVFIRDTGRGIPGDMLPRVFDMFTQLENDPARAQGGLGIGLTLVRQLVELHGGNVSVFSDGLGTGSEFVVRLPLLGAREVVHEFPRAEKHLGAFAQRRVLVVDDNRDAADSLASLLGLLGAEVQTVYSGSEALQKLRSYHPSIILLDIGMPGMDGHEVARRVRRQPEGQDITLIAMTGWGQEQDRSRTRAAGFDHHLTKPADLDVLGSLLFSTGAAEHPPISTQTH